MKRNEILQCLVFGLGFRSLRHCGWVGSGVHQHHHDHHQGGQEESHAEVEKKTSYLQS